MCSKHGQCWQMARSFLGSANHTPPLTEPKLQGTPVRCSQISILISVSLQSGIKEQVPPQMRDVGVDTRGSLLVRSLPQALVQPLSKRLPSPRFASSSASCLGAGLCLHGLSSVGNQHITSPGACAQQGVLCLGSGPEGLWEASVNLLEACSLS